MGSFVVLPLSALGLWRRGSKTQGGEPGAPGFNSWLYSVAGAAAIALARRRAGRPLERRLVAHPIRLAGAHSRVDRRGTDHRPAVAMVRGRLRRRRHSLLHSGTRAGVVGGDRAD